MDMHEILCNYYKSVLEPFFPKSGEMSSYMGMFDSSKDVITDIKILLNNTYSIFKESKFFIDSGTEISHFTTLQNAISIVKDSKIRLYCINSLDDPNEVKHIDDIINLLFNDKNFNHKNLKENFFIFSATDYSSIILDKAAEFNMWRLYGNHGRGIELVFKYVDDSTKIYECFLSKVFYENNSIFEQCYANHQKFISENNLNISGLDDILVPLSLFYKDHIYNIEQEIRIIKKWQLVQNRIDSIGYDFKNGKKVSYYEIPYNLESPGTFPNLELIKIIIGYKYSSEEKIEIENIFKSTNLINRRSIEIEQTRLKQDYFGENY